MEQQKIKSVNHTRCRRLLFIYFYFTVRAMRQRPNVALPYRSDNNIARAPTDESRSRTQQQNTTGTARLPAAVAARISRERGPRISSVYPSRPNEISETSGGHSLLAALLLACCAVAKVVSTANGPATTRRFSYTLLCKCLQNFHEQSQQARAVWPAGQPWQSTACLPIQK